MVIDLTPKFYALSGLSSGLESIKRGQTSRLYQEGSRILDSIRRQQSIECQEDIEHLEEMWKSNNELNDSEKRIGETIVQVLFEELRNVLTREQERAINQLERAMNKRRFFEPDVARIPRMNENVKQVVPLEVVEEYDREADVLLVQFESNEDQVTEVRKKIFETSSLLSVLSSKAIEQQEVAYSVLETATESVGYVDRAEDQLKKAIKNNDGYKFYILMYLWILTLSIWLLDLLT